MAVPKKYDCIVVGAGPAGAMAAYHAAKGGCSVALVEKKERAGTPVRCGEAVGFKGFSASLEIEDRWILSHIKKIRMVAPGGTTVDLINPSKIGNNYVIDREIMDDELVRRAVTAGVSYFPSTPVLSVRSGPQRYTCTTPANSLSASCVVLADGVESKLARDLGWDTVLPMEDIETCAFCHVTHDAINDEAIEFHVGSNNAPGGFVWIFPRGGKKANVGLGILGTKHKSGRAEELLNQFIDRKFPHAQVDNLHCGGVPVGKWLRPLVKNGVLIAGDAARQVNSLTGGGIAYALFAGRIAGETVAHAKTPDGINYRRLKVYQKKWAAYCGKQQMRSYALKSVLLKKDNDAFYDSIAKSLAKENPQELNYMRVFMRTFARHPLILIKTFFLFR